MKDLFEALNRAHKLDEANHLKQICEDFEQVGSYPYKYVPDDYQDIENEGVAITEDEFYAAWESRLFPDNMWLTSEAVVTKEGGYYQVSWGGNDDYTEFSSINECKKFVSRHYEYFQWIEDSSSMDNNIVKTSDKETAKRISSKLVKVRKEIKRAVNRTFNIDRFRDHVSSFGTYTTSNGVVENKVHAYYATDWGKHIENSNNMRDFYTLIPHEGEPYSRPVSLNVIIYQEADDNRVVEKIIRIVQSMTGVFNRPRISTLTNPSRTTLKFCLRDEVVDKINNDALLINGLQLVGNRIIEIDHT